MGISQERLAKSLGLTFQQVQKYERGANRVSASKLYQVACALQVEISYFFDGLPSPTGPDGTDSSATTNQTVERLLFEPHGKRMAEAFPRIRSEGIKKRLAELACVIAANEDREPGAPATATLKP
jgi:transcriptional regulator with XRE-family HTH domain